eukprot:TRINITY_DN480_c0_g1_i1.p1 TRINITY_DN480_c0_g1~~TRINITY_DN480_c0_g1_i1.p1  ORF type:complete len:697 (+),score=203.62 TRINITY_DN480_c0_g1_i1:114-2204(+)
MNSTVCGLFVILFVTFGAFLGLFFGLGWSEIRKNNIFLPSNCTTISSEVKPYRSCSKSCICAECDNSSSTCAHYAGINQSTDRYDVSQSIFETLNKPCCDGYYCCKTECDTCRRCSRHYSCSRRLQGVVPGSREEFLDIVYNQNTGNVQIDADTLDDLDEEFSAYDEDEYYEGEEEFSFEEGSNDEEVPVEDLPAQIEKRSRSRSRSRSSSSRSCGWRTSCHSYQCNCRCVSSANDRACNFNCVKHYESHIEIHLQVIEDGKKHGTATRIDDFSTNKVKADSWVNEFRFQPGSVFSCYVDPDWDFSSDKIAPSEMALEEELGYTWWKWVLIGIPFAVLVIAAVAATDPLMKRLAKSGYSPVKACKKWVTGLQLSLWIGIILPLCFLLAIASLRLLPETVRSLRAAAFFFFGVGWIVTIYDYLKDVRHNKKVNMFEMKEFVESCIVMSPFVVGMPICALESMVLPGFIICTIVSAIVFALAAFVDKAQEMDHASEFEKKLRPDVYGSTDIHETISPLQTVNNCMEPIIPAPQMTHTPQTTTPFVATKVASTAAPTNMMMMPSLAAAPPAVTPIAPVIPIAPVNNAPVHNGPSFAGAGASVMAALRMNAAVKTNTAPQPMTGMPMPGAGMPGAGMPGSGMAGAGMPGAGMPGAGMPGMFGTGMPFMNMGTSTPVTSVPSNSMEPVNVGYVIFDVRPSS